MNMQFATTTEYHGREVSSSKQAKSEVVVVQTMSYLEEPSVDMAAESPNVMRRRAESQSRSSSGIKSWAAGVRQKLAGRKPKDTARTTGSNPDIKNHGPRKLRRKASQKHNAMPSISPEVLPPPAMPQPASRQQVLEAMGQYQKQDDHGRYDHGRLAINKAQIHCQHKRKPSKSNRNDIRFYPDLRRQSRQSSTSTAVSSPDAVVPAQIARHDIETAQQYLRRSNISVERMFVSKLEEPSPTGSNWTGSTLRTWQMHPNIKGEADIGLQQVMPNYLLRKGKTVDLKQLAQQDTHYPNRLRSHDKLPECLPLSPLDNTLDDARPFYCALCNCASYAAVDRIGLQAEECSTSSQSSIDISEGRKVSIVAQNVQASITSVPRKGSEHHRQMSISNPANSIVGHTKAKSQAVTASISPTKTTSRAGQSNSSKRLQRAISAPHPIRPASPSPPPLPRPGTATHKPSLHSSPNKTSAAVAVTAMGLRSKSSHQPQQVQQQPQLQHRTSLPQQVRQKASGAASDVVTRANSMGHSLRDGLKGLLTGADNDVQRQVVRVGSRRWDYIDSQYSTMEAVPQLPKDGDGDEGQQTA